ncbi:hypothetical protein OXX79_004163 [Metschnikowia pulcherrima]
MIKSPNLRPIVSFLRRFSTNQFPLKVSPEISQAVHENKPVVSLESTIITHGFPYPENLEMARAVESKIREHGCVPATCAFIKGVPYVGLEDRQIEQLAATKGVNKVSRRDVGATMAQRLDGGTTIAGTMILSHLAGIDVFATGGLGGVHRDGHITMDVSADLTELSRTPVTVVCAGPKSILDIPRTMEFLETQGVFVGTYNDNGREKVDIPGFFCRSSGVKSPYTFSSWQEIASIVYSQNQVMGLSSGNLVCVPPPLESCLDSDMIESIISAANAEAAKKGIMGKELTPFLLSNIAAATKGKSVDCNRNFVINNAQAACEIAKQLCEMKSSGETNAPAAANSSFQPSTGLKQLKSKQDRGGDKVVSSKKPEDPSPLSPSQPVPKDKVDTIILGSVALDTICTLQQKPLLGDSNPGSIAASLGGVGYNVSLAHKYGLQNQNSKNTYRFVSAVGDDLAGSTIINGLKDQDLDISGIKTCQGSLTAQYNAVLDSEGSLVVACADMRIFESVSLMNHFSREIERAQPRQIVVDCNLSPKALECVFAAAASLPLRPAVIVEPTSAPKSARLSQVNSSKLQVFPHNIVSLITPTAAELEQIHSSFAQREFFDDYDTWFPALDSLGIDAVFREKLTAFGLKSPAIKELLQKGTFQQAFQLLPYIPNILVKVGEHGCLSIKLSTNVGDYKSIPTTSRYVPTATFVSSGKVHEEDKKFGIVVEYYDIPEENKHLNIVNVTGAGDSFLGYLSAALVNSNWMGSEIESLEQEWGKWETIYKSQLASGKSLESPLAISEEILKIE